MRDREPTTEEIKAANDCPMCDAFGICPSHQWLHDLAKAKGTMHIGKSPAGTTGESNEHESMEDGVGIARGDVDD